MKRVFDILASSVGIVLLLPLLIICAIVVKQDSIGPILFRQERVGKNGHLFEMLKFRSMYWTENPTENKLTVGADPRVTRAGKFLRHWKLDELPQLLNVLKGEMSIVGPRPEVPYYVSYYPSEVRNIVLSVRPGITDNSSILLRDEAKLLANVSDVERFYIDVLLPQKLQIAKDYVNSQTLFGDITIIVETLIAIGIPTERGVTKL